MDELFEKIIFHALKRHATDVHIKNEDKYMNYYQIMIIEPINKSYKTIFSDDLDGWDDEIL